jgi:hypothetical protein
LRRIRGAARSLPGGLRGRRDPWDDPRVTG